MSVIGLPKYLPEGAYEDETPEEAATRLHLEHNTVPKPPVRFTPTERKEFPYALYREWPDVERYKQERRVELQYGMDLNNPREARLIAEMIPPYDSCFALDENDRREKKAQGWADSPQDMKAAARRLEQEIAKAAAERQYRDRRLSPKAAAELEAIDDAADHHVVDVPETRKELEHAGALKPKRGRPKKAQAVP